MADSNAQLLLKAGLDVTNVLAEMKKLSNFGEKIQGELKTAATKSAIAFAGLSAAIGLSVSASSDFDKNFSDAITQLDKSGKSVEEFNKEVADLRKGILDLSRNSGQSFDSLNQALYELLSSGVSSADALKTLSVSAGLATAGATDVASATKALIATQTAFRGSAGSSLEVAQKFFQANKFGITTTGQLADEFNKVAGNAASLGFSFDTTLAAAAALTRNGAVPTSEAFTQLSGVFTELLQASTKAARGQDAFQKTFHFSDDITAKLVKTLDLATIKQRGFVNTIRDVNQILGGNEAALATIFGRTESFRAALALTDTQAEAYNTTLGAMQDSTKRASEYADALAIKQETTAFKTAQLKQSIQAFRVELGDQLAPVLVPLLQKLTVLVNKFSELDPKVKSTIGQLLLAATAIAGFGTVAFSASSGLISVIQSVGAISGIIGTIAGAIGGVPLLIGGAIAAIVALFAGIFAFGDKIADGLESLMSKSGQVTNYLRSNFGVVGEILATVIEVFVSFNEEAVIPTIRWLYDLGQSFAEFFSWLNANQSVLLATKISFLLLKEAISTLASFTSVAFKSFQLALGEGMLAVARIMQKGIDAVNAFRASFGLAPIATNFASVVSSLEQTNAQLITSIKATTAAAIERNLALAGKITALASPGVKGATLGASQIAGSDFNGGTYGGDQSKQNATGTGDALSGISAGAAAAVADKKDNPFDNGAGGGGGKGEKTFEEKMAELNKQWQTEEQAHQEHLLREREMEVKNHNERLRLQEDYGKANAAIIQLAHSKELDAVSDFFGQLSDLQNSSNKQLQAIGKAAAIAKMVVDIPRTAFKAYAGMIETIPGPTGMALGAAAAAAATAVGMARLADIKNAKKAAKGGLIGGGIPGQDSVHILGMPDEMIIPANIIKSGILQPSFEQAVDQMRGRRTSQNTNDQNFGLEISWRNDADKYINAKIVRNRALGVDTRV